MNTEELHQIYVILSFTYEHDWMKELEMLKSVDTMQNCKTYKFAINPHTFIEVLYDNFEEKIEQVLSIGDAVEYRITGCNAHKYDGRTVVLEIYCETNNESVHFTYTAE